MNFKEIKDIIKLVSNSSLKEFELIDKDFEIRMRTEKDVETPIVQQAPVVAPGLSIPASPQAAPVATPPANEQSAAVQEDLPKPQDGESSTSFVEIKSPMVGTFYRSSGPDKPVFKQVGDSVSEGETVCIIEAMKLFNEIESEVSGKIVKVLVEDATPVEYDQVLFLVDPKG